jgi:hypothetical protein
MRRITLEDVPALFFLFKKTFTIRLTALLRTMIWLIFWSYITTNDIGKLPLNFDLEYFFLLN